VYDRLGVEMPTEEYDTIGGFVFGLLGRLPQEGDQVAWGPLEFTVEQTDGHRIQKVRVVRREGAPLDADAETPLEAG
jgi:CBS domain containing-hemolysin-like protein